MSYELIDKNNMVMKKFQKRLKAIKKLVVEYQNTTIDNLQEDINRLKLKAYEDELKFILSENDGDIESIEFCNLEELVVDDETIYGYLMQDRYALLSSEIENLCFDVRRFYGFKIHVSIGKNMNYFVYSYKNYKHKSYEKVYRHYKKVYLQKLFLVDMSKKVTRYIKNKEIF